MLYMVTFTMDHQYTPNVSIYTIHGSYGYGGFLNDPEKIIHFIDRILPEINHPAG
jgi:hypothetical protein